MFLFRVRAQPASLGRFLFTDRYQRRTLAGPSPSDRVLLIRSTSRLPANELPPHQTFDGIWRAAAERECGTTGRRVAPRLVGGTSERFLVALLFFPREGARWHTAFPGVTLTGAIANKCLTLRLQGFGGCGFSSL